MVEAILHTLRGTWTGYLEALRSMLPRLLSTLSVVAAGWLIAALARAAAAYLLRLLRVARLAERTRTAELLRKAELPPLDRLLASAVFWLLFLGFLLAGLDALGFETLRALRSEISLLLPRLLAALLILVVGLVLANVVFRLVLLATVNAGWPLARMVSRGVHTLLLTVVVAMALDHAGVARAVVLAAFAIAFGSLMLALAVALGIAGAPIMRRILEERLAARGRREPDGSSHL